LATGEPNQKEMNLWKKEALEIGLEYIWIVKR